MIPNALPPMDSGGDLVGRCSIGPDAQHMASIRPIDIVFGRGPAFYRNPGNRLLRKLVKEHLADYKNIILRRHKPALAKLIVAKLQAKGCRFLHKSSNGTWVEAPSKIVEKKVGHGLRDARLAADRNGGDVNVLWKNFRPAMTKQKTANQVTAIKTTKELHSEKPDNTTANTMDVDPPRDATAAKLLEESLTTVEPSNSESNIHQESKDAGLSSFDRDVKEVFEHWDSGGNVKSIMEPWQALSLSFCCEHWDSGGDVKSITEPWQALPVSFCDSEIGQRLEDSERGGVYISVSPRDGAADDANVGDALNMCAGLCYEFPFRAFPVDNQSQSLGCPLYDGQSLCRWFRNFH